MIESETKKRGRKPSSGTKAFDARIEVRLYRGQLDMVKTVAAKASVTPNQWVRKMITNGIADAIRSLGR